MLDQAEKLERYKQDLANDAEMMDDQRDKANEDMRFVNVSGGMWEDFDDENFANRAKMEFDLVSNFLYRFMGEWNQNRVGVEYRADDSMTSDDDAELINGIFRADFRDGSGKIAVDNAVLEVAMSGVGDFKLATRFEDEGDPENDAQRIEWRPIHEGFNSVYWDGNAKRIDKRDAVRVTELTEFAPDAFERKWPDAKPSSAYRPENRRWYDLNNPTHNGIYIATRYEIVRVKEPVFIYGNITTGAVKSYKKDEHDKIKDELAKDPDMKFIRERKITRQRVEKTIFSGEEILEGPKRIPGKWLPIVRLYGYRAFVDGREWYHGFVRKLKDAARLFNVQMNRLAENSLSDGGQKPIFDPDQMPRGVEEHWADKTNKAWLPAKVLYDDNGNVISAGPTGYLPAPQLDGSTQALMNVVPDFIREVTGGAPQDTMDPKTSGKAIRAMVKRMNLHIQPVMENIETGIEWSGHVYQSIAADIYNRQQMVRTLGRDGTEETQNLLQLVMDEKTGQLVEGNDLRGKKFRVYSDVGPQYESLREETVENLMGVGDFLKETSAGANYIPAVMATIIENMEGVELGPLKDLNRKQMILMGIKEPATDEEKAMLAKAQQNNTNPQEEAIKAIANQANAEAVEAESRARNLDSDSITNLEEARKKRAETMKIISETEDNRNKTLAEIRSKFFSQAAQEAKSLPFGGQ